MKRVTRWKSWAAIVYGFVAVTLGGFRNNAWSEDVAPPQSLEQRVNILERKLEIAAEDEAAKARTKVSTKASASDGFQIQSADKDYSLKIRLLIQADSRFFKDDRSGNLTDAFLVRRARPILEGTVGGYTNFLLTPDFASNGKTVLYDAYFDVAPWTFAKLRVGKFKPPIGLEHLQSDPALIFAERAFPSDLVPNRDTGLQLFGDVFGSALSYAVALTNGSGDNNTNTSLTAPVTSDTDNNDGKEVTGRISAKPFKNTEISVLQGLGVGIGASYAKQSGITPNYVTPGQVAIFAAAAPTPASFANTPVIDGAHTRIAPEFSWYYHSLGIYSEYVRSSQVWRVGNVLRKLTNTAGQLAGSYVLTGEDASYTGVKPRKPFDPKNGTWGAFEVTGRIQELYLDPDSFKNTTVANTSIATVSSVQRATAYGFGVNWYLSNNVKLATSYEETSFDKGAASGDRPNEKVVISRWQLLF
jgi:phosphate-selective porin OprO/OprP